MKHFMNILVLLHHLLLLLVPVISLSSPCQFPAIINFGDSNSDTGGFSATFGPLGVPFGETFFKKPAGRFSDGRLIIDFMAESLGLPYITAYLDSLGANFSHGASFATAISTILSQNQTLSNGGNSPFSIDIQLQQFLQFKSRSHQVSSRGRVFKDLMPKYEYFKQALYTIDIGQNDLTQGYLANKSMEQYVPDALNKLSNTIKSLYDNGGKFFWIHNTGPLGCLPYVLVRVLRIKNEVDAIGCFIPMNLLAQQFNRMLHGTVVKLRRELPLATIAYIDVYSIKYSLFRTASKNGFERPLTACCGYGGGAYNYNPNVLCGDTAMVNGRRVLLGESCKDPSKRIIWDGVHYTEAANKLVSKKISSGKFSDLPSASLGVSCHKKYT